MRRLRTGIIGGGFIGAQHVEAVRRLGYVDVAAIAGSSLESARAGAKALQIECAYGSYVELLADPDIDVIHTCTPNMLHYQINRAALASGKHVISEKPLAMNARETTSLVDLADKSGRLAAVNFNHRGYPMVSAGQLGAVRLLHGAYLQDWLLYQTDWNWRLDPEAGGASRAVADIGSHWADLIQHVIGQRIVRVLADLQTVVPGRKCPISASQTFGSSAQSAASEEVTITTEDYAAILFQTDRSARGVFSVSQVSAGHKNQLTFEINGSSASTRWNAYAPNELWLGYRDQAKQLLGRDPSLVAPEAKGYMYLPGGHAEGWPDALKNVMGDIYASARDGHVAPTSAQAFATFRDGHQAALLVDAILESAQRGAWVDVLSE
jgi:predicted dehydrogenase